MSDPDGFTSLEQAALETIFAETPDLEDRLQQQLFAAVVTGRKNTGVGFFTEIAVPDSLEPVEARQLGQGTYAYVEGLKRGFGFVLMLENGRLRLLDTYSSAGEDTSHLSPAKLFFIIVRSSNQQRMREETDIRDRVVSTGTWLYSGSIPYKVAILARPARFSPSRFDADDRIDDTTPIPSTPDGLVYISPSCVGEEHTLAAAKAMVDREPWGPVTWDPEPAA